MKYLYSVMLSMMLVACGGSGGSIDKGGVSSSSSSPVVSSVSSSSSSVDGCSGADGEIFNNCLVTGELTSYVYYETGIGETSIDGEMSSHIQWSIVDSEDDDHGNVIEVIFNALDPTDLRNDSGWFGITVGQGRPSIDLSEYANGAINFDVKIIQNGFYKDMLEFSMDCGWPCSSEPLWVQEPAGIGEWKSYSIPLDRAIRSGLDISKVYIPFMFKPAWGFQRGQYIFQIDNIKISKTYIDDFVVPQKPTTDKLKNYYVNGLDAESGYAVTNNEQNNNVVLMEGQFGAEKFIDIQYLTNSASEFFIYPIGSTQYDMTNFYHGDLVFDLKVNNYSDSAGRIIVNSFCVWPCRAAPAYDAGRPDVGVWTTHTVPIKQLVKDGLLLHRIQNGFHLKYSSDVRAGLNIQLKNIRWEYVVE